MLWFDQKCLDFARRKLSIRLNKKQTFTNDIPVIQRFFMSKPELAKYYLEDGKSIYNKYVYFFYRLSKVTNEKLNE